MDINLDLFVAGVVAAAIGILGKMGYSEMDSYERYRETYRLGNTKITLDGFPFGYFLKIEGNSRLVPE